MAAKAGKWTLHYGTHRGTLISRKTGIVKGLDSSKACRERLAEIERGLSRGCMIWFAEAHAPNGKRFVIHKGNPYREE